MPLLVNVTCQVTTPVAWSIDCTVLLTVTLGSRTVTVAFAELVDPMAATDERAVPLWLPHAEKVGFSPTTLAPFGQARDWVLATRRGHRLHMHEFANGQRIIRLDRASAAAGQRIDAPQPVFTAIDWLSGDWLAGGRQRLPA